MTLTPVLKRFGRLGLRLASLIVALCVAILVGFAAYSMSMLPPLQPWHTEILTEEYSAKRNGDLDFNHYLNL